MSPIRPFLPTVTLADKVSRGCAQVNIKLDELGDQLYEVALHGEILSVEKYLEFKEKSGWGLLRNYLLHAITFDWSRKPSVVQYGLLLDIISVDTRRLTVSLFWLALAGQTLGLVRPF